MYKDINLICESDIKRHEFVLRNICVKCGKRYDVRIPMGSIECFIMKEATKEET